MDTRAEVVRIELRAYVDDDPDLSWLEQTDQEMGEGFQAEGKKRLESYGDEWWSVGLQCRAIVRVLNAEFSIDSDELWGIESDSGTDYFLGVWTDNYAEIRGRLLNRGFTADELNVVPVEVVSTPDAPDYTFYN